MNPSEHALRDSIISLLKTRGNRVLSIREIATRLADTSGEVDREVVGRLVEAMEDEGVLVAIRGKRYSLLEFTPFESDTIRIRADGHGSIRSPDGDVAIDRRKLKGAMNGDRVLVRIDRSARSPKRRGDDRLRGEVVRVLRREHETVVGRFHAGEPAWVRPFDVRIDTDIFIDQAGTLDAADGQMVDVRIDQYPGRESDARGHVMEVLGYVWEPGVDIEIVIRKFHLPHQFPDDVLAEADAVSMEVDPAEIAERVDLRDRDIVTIDGETAKDFDDAIEVRRVGDDRFELGVHIADVSHYVRPGTPLDREAFDRGSSVYFPGRAIPMLPERLSNGICSLNPRVDRLAFSVVIEIDRRGRFVDRKFFRSVIRTRERMTYTDVNAILTDRSEDLLLRYEPMLESFERMRELFEILSRRRRSRGSIDFDLPQHEVLLTEGGEIESIEALQRNVAHRLIEEFMLAANEVVAEHLVNASQPAVYRVHSQPDPRKIEDLKEILKEFEQRLRGDPENVRPSDLQRVLSEVEGRDEERFLTELILRSMKRALYSEESNGHFALALQHYLHFTSPIRRYPDLIVHRMLGSLLTDGAMWGEGRERAEARLPSMAVQCSERERRAEAAEREVLEWKKVIFMRDKVGREFDGNVTGVAPFGLFIELREVFVQGLVPVATIGGDYWNYHEHEHRLRGERTSREFRLGDAVRVRVAVIDEDRRQIELELIEAGGVPISARQRGSRRGGQ